MSKALSLDLPIRVLQAVAEGASHRAAAARFGRQRRSARIEAQGALIRQLHFETPDITTEERRVALAERGQRFGDGTLQRFFRRHGLTRKRRSAMRRSRTAPTS